MGNKNGHSISLSQYSRSGLSEGELLEIHSFFNSFDPKDGYISLEKLQEVYGNSEDGRKFSSQFQGKERIDFETFLDVCHRDIQEKKKKFKNVEVDVDDPQVSCFYCPYPTFKVRDPMKKEVNCCS